MKNTESEMGFGLCFYLFVDLAITAIGIWKYVDYGGSWIYLLFGGFIGLFIGLCIIVARISSIKNKIDKGEGK